MELELWIILLLCGVYFFAGFVDSVAGGGGLIAVPVFLLTGIPPEFVLGTNKLAAAIGTGSSVLTYSKSGLIVWRLALIGLPVALLGGFLGSKILMFFDSETIGRLVVFFLPLGILATLMPKKETSQKRKLTKLSLYVIAPVICLLIGFYDGFVGPGTGSFFILALHFALGLGLVQASATSKILNLATNFSSLCVFVLHGKVLYILAIPLALANIAGNIIGSKMAIRIGSTFVRKILILSLFILLVSLVWKFYISG